MQIFEIAGNNSGREGGKFLERQKVNNPYSHKYYTEKNFNIGNLIYVNTYFKIIQNEEYTKKYMEIIDSNNKNVISRIIMSCANLGNIKISWFIYYMLLL